MPETDFSNPLEQAMQPLKLTLKGFRGIRDGLGQDVLTLDFERLADGVELVAIAGANGRGKTTLMDNMHPYLTMPVDADRKLSHL